MCVSVPVGIRAGLERDERPRAREIGAAGALVSINPAATYSPGESPPKYHRRWRSSLPCSEWERVFPRRYGHRNIWLSRACATRALQSEHEASRLSIRCRMGGEEQEDPKPSAD